MAWNVGVCSQNKYETILLSQDRADSPELLSRSRATVWGLRFLRRLVGALPSGKQRIHSNHQLSPGVLVTWFSPTTTTTERRAERRPEPGTEKTVDDKVERRVDVDEQLADVVEIEDGVAARVAVRVAHEVERTQRRLTQDGDDDDGDEHERHFL